MRKLLLAALIALAPLAASAQSLQINRSQTGNVGALVTATDPSGNTGKVVLQGAMLTDSSGVEKGTAGNPLITQAASGGATTAPVTAGAATATNSSLMGCRSLTTLDTFANTNQGALTCDSRGGLYTVVKGSGGTAAADVATTSADAYTTGTGALTARGLSFLFNGSGWDRGFTCANSATVNVTAGNTTQIVGLSGSTVIRVCSITISMSAAGTAGVYTGTGTNCGTGTTALVQDMTLATGTPWSASAPAGGSLVRSSAGGEICVKAATGNVTGFITYTQY
jgi:hypothetical protein